MGEKTTTCPGCNRTMLQSTADEHNGFCVPCSRNPEVAMTEDFRLDDEITAKLLTIGEDPNSDRFRGMQWGLGRDFLCSYIDHQTSLTNQTNEGLPRLIAFADSCRLMRPPKLFGELAGEDRAIYTIVEEMFTQGFWKYSGVTIFAVPFVALQAAEAFRDNRFPGDAVLTHDELKRWREIYPDSIGGQGWCTVQSYDVYTNRSSFDKILPLGDDRIAHIFDEMLGGLAPDETPWIETHDCYNGLMMGQGHASLLGWNGKQSRRVCNVMGYMT